MSRKRKQRSMIPTAAVPSIPVLSTSSIPSTSNPSFSSSREFIDLERRVYRIEFSFKVISGILGLFGLSSAVLFYVIYSLGHKVNDLAQQIEKLEARTKQVLSDIDTKRKEALADIAGKKTDAVDSVNGAKTTGLAAVSKTKDDVITSLITARDEIIRKKPLSISKIVPRTQKRIEAPEGTTTDDWELSLVPYDIYLAPSYPTLPFNPGLQYQAMAHVMEKDKNGWKIDVCTAVHDAGGVLKYRDPRDAVYILTRK